jgi:flagellin FlaB
MFERLVNLHEDERGLSALETAIVLIAFVVVAAVFAFTMLSAGMFATERSKEAVYAGLEEVRGSMELRGSIVATATTTGVDGHIDNLNFTVSNVAGGEPIDLTDNNPSSNSNKVVIDYLDLENRVTNLMWDATFTGNNDGDMLLEDGELAKMTVYLTGTTASSVTVGVNTLFQLEVKPPKGGVIVLERTTPAYIDPVMDLK